MSKLQLRTRKRDGKTYREYSITLPEEYIRALAWQKGDTILVELVRGTKLSSGIFDPASSKITLTKLEEG